MKHFIFLAYSASAVTFLSGLIRDWILLQYSHYAKEFFDLLYFASLASGFIINSITLAGRAPTFKFLLTSTVCTVILATAAGYIFLLLPISKIILSCVVIALWIIGAVASRSLICAEKIFIGRIRESVAAAAASALILAGANLDITFAAGVMAGTAWALWASREHWGAYFSPPTEGTLWHAQIQSIIFSNISSMSVMAWALIANRSSETLWGMDPTVVVRISVYFFQILSIGSIVAVVRMPELSNILKNYSWAICFFSLALGLVTVLLSSAAAAILVPLLAAIAHYAGVAHLHRHQTPQAPPQTENNG